MTDITVANTQVIVTPDPNAGAEIFLENVVVGVEPDATQQAIVQAGAVGIQGPAGGAAGSVSFLDLADVPVTFPPSPHFHVIGDVSGLLDALNGKQAAGSYATGAQGLLASTALQPGAQIPWTDVTGKPTTFPAAAHNHSDATNSAAGFMSAADKTKLDGIAAGAQVNAPTNLSYDAPTRLLASSTGADATLPLMSDANAGLVPASGGGTANFLRADGTWAAPGGGGGGAASWGSITGALSAQTDLKAALDAKADIAALGLWDWWYEWRVGSTSATGSDMFTGSAISSGTATTGPASASVLGYNPFGVLLRSSATINSGFRYQTSHLSTDHFGVVPHKFRAQFSWQNALADRTVRAGYLDTQTSSDATDGAYFEIVSGVASIKTASNNVRTTGGTTLTLTLNTPYTFEIDVDAAGSSARFRIWQGTNETPVYDQLLTTNIPTASAMAFGAGLVATYGVAAAADIGVFYTIGIGTVAGFQRATGRT